jgi:hypothetical protein
MMLPEQEMTTKQNGGSRPRAEMTQRFNTLLFFIFRSFVNVLSGRQYKVYDHLRQMFNTKSKPVEMFRSRTPKMASPPEFSNVRRHLPNVTIFLRISRKIDKTLIFHLRKISPLPQNFH